MFEVFYCIDLLRSAAGDARHIFGETLPHSMSGQIGMTVRQPLGVIAGIAPFNAPFLLAMKKVVLALAAGNCFVLKPSEETPVTGLKIVEIFHEAKLPPGVLNVVPGAAKEVGDVLLTDPRVRMITFTGSTRVGKLIAVEAARNLEKFTLEMGGKNPLIVLRDADVDYAVRAGASASSFTRARSAWPTRASLSKLPCSTSFVRSSRLERRATRSATPTIHKPVIGPLIRRTQCAFIDEHVQDAAAQGAKVLNGRYAPGQLLSADGDRGGDGADADRSEESFGPITSIIKVDNAEEALRIANDTGRTRGRRHHQRPAEGDGSRTAARVRYGPHQRYNCFRRAHVPFGGIEDSGFGREGGNYSMEEMTELKWITIQLGQRQFPF